MHTEDKDLKKKKLCHVNDSCRASRWFIDLVGLRRVIFHGKKGSPKTYCLVNSSVFLAIGKRLRPLLRTDFQRPKLVGFLES